MNAREELVIEAWGLEYRRECIYVMSEDSAREAASDDLRLVCKVGGEWRGHDHY